MQIDIPPQNGGKSVTMGIDCKAIAAILTLALATNACLLPVDHRHSIVKREKTNFEALLLACHKNLVTTNVCYADFSFAIWLNLYSFTNECQLAKTQIIMKICLSEILINRYLSAPLHQHNHDKKVCNAIFLSVLLTLIDKGSQNHLIKQTSSEAETVKATDNQNVYQSFIDPMNLADDQEKDRQFVTSLARGLELLRCFTPSESTLSNLDLARKSGLPRPTVSRLTHTLARLGYLRPLPRGKYQLDVGVMAFGYSMISNLPIRAIAQPLMVNLANAVGATVAMSARDRLDMVYLDVVQSSLRSTIRRQTGTRLPIHQSSAGRAYLAAIPTQEAEILMNHLRESYPSEWSVIRTSLERAFRDYADYGYCLSIGEWQRKVNAVAVPLHHPQLGILSFNCGGPEFQISREKLEESIGPQLVQLVNDIKTQIS